MITRIPKSPEFITGITNLRGEIIGVVDLIKRLNLDKLEKFSVQIKDPDTRLVIIKSKNEKLGILVSRIDGMYHVDDKIESLEQYNFCKGRVNISGRSSIILDIEDILNFNKVAVIQKK